MATNHEELLETIGSMTVLELSEFVDAFKDKFNVTALAAPEGQQQVKMLEPLKSNTNLMLSSRASVTRKSKLSRLCARSPGSVSRKLKM